MNDRQMLRYRREMHRRIREVVAERRLAMRSAAPADSAGEPATAGRDQAAVEDESLIGG
ncbi:hypothetical protein [Plantactinospora sp. GCM10030261]|uniref:hypothetical protein n=1 Tax=Plantactinospora sp. GCM10030261 TaxID=3273420 RepID=UPI00360D9609